MGRRAAGSATGDGVKLGAEGKGRWEAPSDGGQGKKGAEHWDTLLEGVGAVAAFGMRMKTRHDKGRVRNLGTYRRVSQVSKGPARRVTHGARKEGWPTSIAGRDAWECADSAMAHGCTKGAAGLLLLRKGNG